MFLVFVHVSTKEELLELLHTSRGLSLSSISIISRVSVHQEVFLDLRCRYLLMHFVEKETVFAGQEVTADGFISWLYLLASP